MSDDNNKLRLGACVAMLAGGCIGSSIFSLSGMTMYYAGPAAIFSWLGAAIICGLYGLQAAELSIRYPKSGGVFVFPARAIGPKWGFIAAWGYLVSNSIAVAFAAIYVGTYLGVSWQVFSKMQIILAIAAVIFVSWMNMNKITMAGKINNILVISLIVCMLIYVCVAFSHPNFDWANFANFFDGAMGKTGWIEAIPNAMTGYGSIVAIAFMVSQVHEPNKTVPKSLMIALGLVVCLYMLMIVATMGHVDTQFLIDNPGMRFIPMFAAAFTSMSDVPWLSKVISIAAVLALLTTMLVVEKLTADAMKAMADDDMLPSALKKENKHGAPVATIVVVAVVSAILSCFPSQTEILVNLGSLFAAVNISLVIISAVFARKKVAYVEGNFRAPGGNVVSIIAVIAIVSTYIPKIIGGGNGMMWIFTIALYAIGGVVMMYYTKKKKAD
ncbi:APC family permease [Faecalicatena contorta]|uniref:APC family permease n=1 Tax=Faecalicatena contorta TaxID=39482 RepID=UPI001F35B269|nr:APC family permease [Faecalicatena contorta]